MRCVGVLDSLTELRSAIADWKPDVVFNLLEEFDGIVTYDQHVVAFLELMRQPYTGCNPRGLLLSRDKSLSQAAARISPHSDPAVRRVPPRRSAIHVPRKLRFPLFVKSTVEDASLGIAQASVVEDVAKLKERIEFVHEQVGSDALVEEFIEGRELYVGVLGNDRLTRLPVWEMVFGSMPGLAGRDRDPQGEVGQALPGEIRHHHARRGRSAARRCSPVSISCRGAFTVRSVCPATRAWISACRPDGQVYVLEANANPNLEAAEDFAESARAAGVAYDELLEKILGLGLSYRAEWRAFYG